MFKIATMRYIKKNTTIPVPDVFVHDSDEDHQVGGEWMIMECVSHCRSLVCYALTTRSCRSMACPYPKRGLT